MRIIAGKDKGATITAPPGRGTRPTADRVREALFSILGDVSGLSVLDLFAGSGALGLEALSRGASSAVLVDSRAGAMKAMERNIAKLRATAASAVRRDYLVFLKDAAKKGWRYDLIFIDPPYRMHRVIGGELGRRLPLVAAPGARLVVESSSREDIDLPFGKSLDRVYGDTRVCIYILQQPAPGVRK
jgi:16S rRNA (guanine966-N2)-methyltransferase